MEFSPCLTTLFIKGFIRPLHDMESIDATRAIRQLFLDAIVNPACTVAGNEVNPFALLGSQFVQELHERLLAVPFANPYDLAGLIVDDDSDVYRALAN